MATRFFAPETLQQADRLFQTGKVRQVLFSSGTYQVEVKDHGEEFWPFLQISDAGELKDHFCSCDTVKEGACCVHEAAAWLKIFNQQMSPLHVRFQGSLWHQLFKIAFSRHGEESSFLKKSEELGFCAYSPIKKRLFSVYPKTAVGKKLLKELIFDKKEETEETSLKFSNLDPDELALWKKGMPTPGLLFELSFWSDVAKWCFQQQEENQLYTISFITEGACLPSAIQIDFTDISFFFYIAEVNWPYLIPSLLTVSSPLQVYSTSHQQVKQMTYDEKSRSFHLDLHLDEDAECKKNCKAVGDWVYVPFKGFYTSYTDLLLKQKIIDKTHIAEFFQKHIFLIKQHLAHTKLHEEPVTVKYKLSFNSSYDLKIQGHLFEEGDLEQEDVAQFGNWIYLPHQGFYHLENVMFPSVSMTIAHAEVSRFISRHRHWLHGYEGFETHVTCIDSSLTYELKEDGLLFKSKLDLAENSEDIMDFHEWVYIRGRGFYAKDQMRENSTLRANLLIPHAQINTFIRQHKDELESVSGFFAEASPLESSGLKISLNENDRIYITPSYQFHCKPHQEKIQIFADYTFTLGLGFSPIPSHLKLPSPYFEPLEIDQATEPYFVAYEIDTLKPYIVDFDVRLQKPESLQLNLEFLQQEDKGSWKVKLVYQTPMGKLSPFDVWKALEEGKKYFFSPAGLIILKSPRFNWIKLLSKKRWQKKGDFVHLTTLELMNLLAFDPVIAPYDEQSLELWEHLQKMQPSTNPSVEGLQSTLRPYQISGLNWLWFLYSYGLSGLLCDEMGLGKTHQAMGLLNAALRHDKKAKFLVVCPTSVIFHWQDLLERFLPHLRICIYYGSHRTVDDFTEKFDVLLTSYGTLRSQKEGLGDLTFSIAIFDEIQMAKNHLSQTHKALKAINAHTRIGLTGTPIENHLLELKALFDVILPGYMPAEASYKELFVNPIEKLHDQDKKQLLSRLIHPFVLRRKKSEVLLELPEKVESIAYAFLSEEQKKLYDKVYKESKEQLLSVLHDSSKPAPYLHVFALLTKLKQICNHPALYLNEMQSYQKHTSGKWNLFIDLVSQTRMNGQKLVVFSQYLGMIEIIENYLKEEKIQYAAITGSTRDRKEQVEKFKTDPHCEVFVGSLQAAGVGIDLISASVLIHYDRWWNPAKENQATDRIHRMGQTRGVQIFKLITRHTLEEKIHQLIERKLSLADDILGYDDQAMIKTLTRDELIRLLQLIEPDPEE